METGTQNPPQPCIKDPADSPTTTNITISDHHDLLPQLQSLQQSFDTIQSKSSLMEQNLYYFSTKEMMHSETTPSSI